MLDMRRTLIAAAGLASLVLVAPAAAQTTDPPPPTSYFFQCTNPAKVQNLEKAVWGTTAPTASFQSGAGCGSADPGLLVTQFGVGPVLTNVDFYGTGEHTGPIQAMNVELHSLLLSRARVPADIPGVFELIIDDQEVVLAEGTPRIGFVTSSTGATEKLVFSFARKKKAGEAVAAPLAAGPGKHTVQVRFSSNTLDYQNAWVWGATEVPARVEIDPAKLSSPKVTI